MAVIFLERLADGSGVLAAQARAIKLPAGWTVVNHPLDSLAGSPDGPGQVTGYLELVPPPAAQGVAALTWHQTATISAGAPDVAAVLLRNSTGGAITVSGFEIWPHGSLTASDTDYASLAYALSAFDGSGIVALATATTKTTGSGGTGSWVSGTPIAFPVGPYVIPANKTVRLVLGQHGAGVDVPAFDLLAY